MYDSGYALGEEQAGVVGGVLGVCVIREDEMGERRVEYFNERSDTPSDELDRFRADYRAELDAMEREQSEWDATAPPPGPGLSEAERRVMREELARRWPKGGG